MVERRRIVELWRNGGAVALATLIQVEGSSYRAAGARLLIGPDGTSVGSISGGCLEAEIVRKARWMVRNGAHVERYSTVFDDTAEIPYGLGCGGTVDVLVESAGTPEFEALMEAMEASLHGARRVVRTWVPAGGAPLRREIGGDTGEGVLFRSEGTEQAAQTEFAEVLDPPQRLLLFGAGDDAQPVVRMASLLGWTTVVADTRVQLARPARFPEAERVIASSAAVRHMHPTRSDAAVLMTHSYEQDRHWLEQILPCEPKYLGLLGSRHRSALLVSEAAKTLGWTLERASQRLFSPVGLDLGGDGAEAIALSVVAEVQACINGKLGTSRHLTPGTIREQVERGGASRYLQAQCAL